MLNLRFFAAIIIGIGLAVHESLAFSTQRNPLGYVTRIDDAVINTPSHRIHAYSDFELSFYIHNRKQKIRLTLSPNHDVLADTAQVNILGSDGTLKSVQQVERTDHKVFKGNTFVQHEGQSEWTNVGWSRILIHRDGPDPIFEGAFRLEHDNHHVLTSTNYHQTRHRDDPEVEFTRDEFMVVWRDSDILPSGGPRELKRDMTARTCMSDSLEFNNDLDLPLYRGIRTRSALELEADMSPWWSNTARSIFGRQTDDTLGGNGNVDSLVSTIGSTNGCPTTRRVALVGIATDCTYTAQFNSTSSVRANIINLVNTASALYESTFNISLGIQNLTITEGDCPSAAPESAPWNKPCGSDTTITDRLNLFSQWRGRFNDTNAYWTLMSTCNTDAAVGLAWLGQLCSEGSASSSTNETIAGANVVVRTEGGGTEWQVFAHETGHTFGAVHDCTENTCASGDSDVQRCCPLSSGTCDAGGAYIMNPSTGTNIQNFSPCSIGNICTALLRQSVKSTCLTNNKDINTITGSQCGNGIVESGEDCDCGGDSGCADNPCCNAATCKFTSGSVCDPSNEECCSDTCQFKSQGEVCRVSTGVCDPEETCTGTSATCPSDETASDGTNCGDGLQCASGQCTSRDLQCRSVLGVSTTSNDTGACDGGCRLLCHSSTLPAYADCFFLMQNFLDGTPCSGGGTCSNGVCQGASVVDEITSWIDENKNIVIPVASVVGGLILIAILSCCISMWRRKRRSKRVAKPVVGVPPPMQNQGTWGQYGGAWGPNNRPQGGRRQSTRNISRSGNEYSARNVNRANVDAAPLMGDRQPTVPDFGRPPSYTPYNGGASGWTPSRDRSVRYA